jgi:hypothetical protein
LATGGTKLVIHGAVVVVTRNQQTALLAYRAHEPHEQLHLLPFLQGLLIHLKLPGQLGAGRRLWAAGNVRGKIALGLH